MSGTAEIKNLNNKGIYSFYRTNNKYIKMKINPRK